MGFRSRLVLAKLGFDLRQRYDAQLGRELRDELGQLASRLNQDAIVSLTTSRNCAAGDCQAIGGG